MSEKKQIPFRYPEELEEDFEELFKLQYYMKKKNTALINALKIAAAYIKKVKIKKDDGYGLAGKLRDYVEKDLKIDIKH